MISKQIGDSSTSSSILGRTSLQQQMNSEIQQVVPQLIQTAVQNLDEQIQGALDRIVDEQGLTISYQPKSLSSISTERLNESNVNMNNKRLENLASVPNLGSIQDILNTPSVAVNVTTMVAYNALSVPAQILLDTNYCGPLSTTTDLKDKIVTNMGNAELVIVNDPNGASKTKQGINYGTLIQLALTTGPEDRQNYYGGAKKIFELGDALLYTDSDIRTLPDPLEANVFNIDQALLQKYLSQATNLKSVQNVAVTLEEIKRENFDSKEKQIKNGKQATDPKDYVTLDQVVAEEIKEIEWLETDPIPANKESKYIFEDDRVILISNPKKPTGNNFQIKGTSTLISEEKQVSNLKSCRDEANKKHSKTEDVNLQDTYKVINMPNPSASHHAVNKSYCDANSGKDPSGGLGTLFSTLFGGIAGGVAGALTSLATQGITSTLGSLAGSGLAAVGSIAGSVAGSVFSSGLRTGSAADWANAKPQQTEGVKQLIDNLEDDRLNGGSANGENPNGSSIASGPFGFNGLVRLARNAQVGLFEVI